jgi:hypothetical protein
MPASVEAGIAPPGPIDAPTAESAEAPPVVPPARSSSDGGVGSGGEPPATG